MESLSNFDDHEKFRPNILWLDQDPSSRLQAQVTGWLRPEQLRIGSGILVGLGQVSTDTSHRREHLHHDHCHHIWLHESIDLGESLSYIVLDSLSVYIYDMHTYKDIWGLGALPIQKWGWVPEQRTYEFSPQKTDLDLQQTERKLGKGFPLAWIDWLLLLLLSFRGVHPPKGVVQPESKRLRLLFWKVLCAFQREAKLPGTASETIRPP